MEDAFTRRGFVGALAMGAAGALWLPRAARAVDRLDLRARWDAEWLGENLRLTLHLRHEGTERFEAPPAAIDVIAALQNPDERALRLVLQPTPPDRQVRRTRSGRRLERRIFVGNDEVPYDTFVTAVQGRRDDASLRVRTRLRGALSDYAERHRPLVEALTRLEATVPVRTA